MKAITTRYRGMTATRPARYTASDLDGNRATVSGDTRGYASHEAAARALCAKMGWYGELVGGAVADGYVWVWIDNRSTLIAIDPTVEALKGIGRVCVPRSKRAGGAARR